MLPYLAAFPGHVALTAAVLIAAKMSAVALPLVLKQIVDTLEAQDAARASLAVPGALLLGYGALRFANVLFGELRDAVFGRVTDRAMRRSALSVFTHLHRLDLDFHLSRQTGGLSRDIERGVSGVRFLLRFLVYNILPTLLELGLVAAILSVGYGAAFALIAAASVLLYIAFSVAVTEWRTHFVRAANRLDSDAQTRAVDSLLNYETVKYFGAEAREAQDYDRALAAWERAQQQQRWSLSALNAGQALIVATGITAMMWLAAQRVTTGRLTLGDFVAINAYMIQLFVPLNMLGFVYREIRRAVTDMGRMFQLLDRPPAVADAPSARALHLHGAELSFDDLHFAYAPGREVLHGVTFTVPAGQRVAVVGASGAGKSTLARLLFRFYDPQQGAIRIDGQDLRALSRESLRAAIAVVPQDTVLFNETLRFNLLYAAPDCDEATLRTALRMAHLEAFVARLPDGLETRVGERGLRLSGGEKQRVAIARALLKAPAILIFDEATSSLDLHAEAEITAAMRDATRARTTLVIAHRLSTVTDADRIVVLDAGRIVEQGRHAELLAADGAYAALWRRQHPGPGAPDEAGERSAP